MKRYNEAILDRCKRAMQKSIDKYCKPCKETRPERPGCKDCTKIKGGGRK